MPDRFLPGGVSGRAMTCPLAGDDCSPVIGHLGVKLPDLELARRYYGALLPQLDFEPFVDADDLPSLLGRGVADCYNGGMATTSPARIDDELYASAKLVGSVMSRSASQQVAHWARIGRALEASGIVSPKAIAEVLTGDRRYDELGVEEQAVVRAEWAERIEERRTGLDLAATFAAEGRSFVELDDDDNVIER